jgi:hypothetical protein
MAAPFRQCLTDDAGRIAPRDSLSAPIGTKGNIFAWLDLNPIEQVFAKLKTLLRKAAPRSREALWRTIGEKIDIFSPTECTNYLRNCGYGHPA